MYTVCNFSSMKNEMDMIENALLESFAYYSDESLDVKAYGSADEFIECVSAQDNIDMSCVEVTKERGETAATALRKEHKNAQLVIISDISTSPVLYMKPTVMASALFLRPLNSDSVKKGLSEVLENQQQTKEDAKNIFAVKSGGETEYINFDKICYFEARDKKTYVCTKKKEIGFYNTIEKLEETLPGNFRRCHRSFIVNVNCIEKIEFSSNSIFLYGGIFIPLSRSYKGNFRNIK